MRRFALLVPVAVALLAGCGGQPPAGTAGTAASAVATPPSQTSGTLSVAQEGTAPPLTMWYLRIESQDGQPLAEKSYPSGQIAMTRLLPPGKYRVVSWHRPCTATCPSGGEQGLGPLAEVCGALVDVSTRVTTTATVVIDADGACTVRVH